MKVLLTGATGVIGQKLLTSQLARELTLIGSSRSPSTKYAVLNYDTTENLHGAISGMRLDAVIHAAGQADPMGSREKKLFHQANVEVTRRLARICKECGVKRFIYLSSSTVYGCSGHGFDENSTLNPCGNYGRSKSEAETIISTIYSGESHILRLAPVYSGNNLRPLRQRVTPIKRLNRAFLQTTDVARHSLCHEHNLTNVISAALVRESLPPGIYNVSDPVPYSQLEIFEALVSNGLTTKVTRIPRFINQILRRTLIGTCDAVNVSPVQSAAKYLIGSSVNVTSLERENHQLIAGISNGRII